MKTKILIGLTLIILSACNPSSKTVDPTSEVPNIENISPTPTPAPTAPPDNGTVADFKLTCEEARFVSLLNIYRANNNLNLVAVSKNGVESTRWHAQDMIDKNYFSHTEPNGRTFSVRAAAFGYSAWAENIAAGNTSASATFCQWKNSPGHNTNMLRAEHRSIGIGNANGVSVYRSYWANNFGPAETDLLVEPLTNETNCVMPTVVPAC